MTTVSVSGFKIRYGEKAIDEYGTYVRNVLYKATEDMFKLISKKEGLQCTRKLGRVQHIYSFNKIKKGKIKNKK